MKDSRFSKILTEGTRGAEAIGPRGSASSPQGEPRPNGDGGKRPARELETAHISLYEDTLSRRPESPWRTVGLIVAGLLVAAGLLAFFAGRSSDIKPLITISDPASEKSAQPAESSNQTPNLTEPESHSRAAAAKPLESVSSPPRQSLSDTTDRPKVAAGKPVSPQLSKTTAVVRESKPDESSIQRPQPPKVSAEAARPKAVERASGASSDTPQPGRKASEAPASTEQVRATAPSSEDPSTPAVAEAADGGEPAAESDPRGSDEYQQLLQNSSVATRLVTGGISTLSFQTWRVVQQTDTETWIDLIGRWNSSGDEVHFIWSVDRQSGAVRPLSEAARNLEHSDS